MNTDVGLFHEHVQPVYQKSMTTKELAEVLGVDVRTVLRAAEKIGYDSTFAPLKIAGGIQNVRVFDEEQVTLIKQEIAKHHNVATVKELAEELHVAEQTVKNAIYELRQVVSGVFDNIERNSQGGYLFNEQQVTMIKQEIAKQDRSNLRSSDMKVRGQNAVKKQAEKTMTTKEVAEVLGVSVESVQNAAKALQATSEDFPKFTQGQRAVYNEAQVTAIKLELQNHSKVNALSPKTTLEKQLIIQQAMQLQAEMIAELQAENENQKQRLAIAEPKANWFDEFAKGSNLVEIGVVGKHLEKYGLGAKKIFDRLKADKIIYEKVVDGVKVYLNYFKYKQYFKTIHKKYVRPDGKKVSYSLLMCTLEGVQWIESKYKSIEE